MTAFRYRVTVWREGRSTALRKAEVHLDPKDLARLREVFVDQVNAATDGQNVDLSRYRMQVRRLNNVIAVRRVSVDRVGRTVVKR